MSADALDVEAVRVVKRRQLTDGSVQLVRERLRVVVMQGADVDLRGHRRLGRQVVLVPQRQSGL